MSGSAATTGDILYNLRLEHNKLVADLETLRTGVNALVQTALTGDLLLSDPALEIGTSSKAAIKHGQIIVQIDGMRYVIAAGEVAFTATDHDIADPDAAPREAVYVLSADTNSVQITKGTTAAADAAVAPATPAGEIKLGEVLIQHDGTAIFDATSDDLDAAHLTVTYTSASPVTAEACAAASLTGAIVNTTFTA